MEKISFNKPHQTGLELSHISKALESGRTSGNHQFTKLCNVFFKDEFNFKTNLLTTSCSDALEMSGILIDLKAGDEVIVPSYTFSSTANAFILRGAKIVFADSYEDNPNIDPDKIEALITNRTKAIVVVHYAGVACDMDAIIAIAQKYDIYVIEDAAQAIDSYYKNTPLGSFGDLAAFSFHQTKNIICGEGGLLVVNNSKFRDRAEVIWEKGTNRASFIRGEIKKYDWVDIGASYLLSDVLAAYLYAQLINIEDIQNKRKKIWHYYNDNLKELANYAIKTPQIPDYATANGALYYIVCNSIEQRDSLLKYLKENNIHAVFHYLSLHKSPYFKEKHDGRSLPNADNFTNGLVRLPLFYDLSEQNQTYIINKLIDFFKSNTKQVMLKKNIL